MCGIYGAFGPGILKADLGVIYTLGFLNMQRGVHSTGVARVWQNKHRPVEILKDTMPAMYFFGQKEYRPIMEDQSPVAIMCHNRHATVGDHGDIQGAHPFATERYVGFHNGTLREDKYTTESPFFTDSEALWNDVTERGFEEVLPPLYKESAFALAYYDKELHRIGFVRNDKRPLAFACSKNRDVVFYSSDIRDLEYALDKHNIDARTYSLAPWQLIECDPRRFGFVVPEGKTERVNTWFIEKLEPKPLEPPVKETNLYEYGSYLRPRSTVTHLGTSSRMCCKICDDSVRFEYTYPEKLSNPTWVKDYGYVCNKCDTMLENNFGIDIRDDDADAYIGAYLDTKEKSNASVSCG